MPIMITSIPPTSRVQSIPNPNQLSGAQALPWAQVYAAAVTGILVMMGSNDKAEHRLTQALVLMGQMADLAQITPLSQLISADHTGRSQALYHNQGVCLLFRQPVQMADIVASLKAIESTCGRDTEHNSAAYGYLVALDLDILAVQMAGEWWVIAERYPFKAHELACLLLPDFD